jgi:death on curing protein
VNEPAWITISDVVAFHRVLIATYGGSAGVRDPGLIEGALGRARNVYHYETQDLVVVAATYAHGIAKSHGFVDGNKRAALACAMTFLELNGLPYRGDQAEAVVMVEGLATGDIGRDEFADWLRKLT